MWQTTNRQTDHATEKAYEYAECKVGFRLILHCTDWRILPYPDAAAAVAAAVTAAAS